MVSDKLMVVKKNLKRVFLKTTSLYVTYMWSYVNSEKSLKYTGELPRSSRNFNTVYIERILSKMQLKSTFKWQIEFHPLILTTRADRCKPSSHALEAT